nr:MAG TPA: hypothetical protein [Caudoviricetes sp.]
MIIFLLLALQAFFSLHVSRTAHLCDMCKWTPHRTGRWDAVRFRNIAPFAA